MEYEFKVAQMYYQPWRTYMSDIGIDPDLRVTPDRVLLYSTSMYWLAKFANHLGLDIDVLLEDDF